MRAQLNLLDSHDVCRFLSLCGGDERRMRLAVVFQMLFPGAPCVFYGDEAGLTGVTEPEYRRPMDWENAEGSWFDFYRQVAGLRAKYLNGTERFTVLVAAPQSRLLDVYKRQVRPRSCTSICTKVGSGSSTVEDVYKRQLLDYVVCYEFVKKEAAFMSQVGKDDLGFKIKTISKLLTQNITNSITSLDLTSSQARVLGYLCYRTKRQEKVYPRDIERDFRFTHPTVSGLLQRLEAKGYLSIETSAEDRRCKQIHVTTLSLIHIYSSGAQLFRLGIQMSVDVCRGGDVAVAQPFLNVLHGHTLLQQQAGAGVPQIVKAYFPQAVLLQQLGEVVSDGIGQDKVSHLIHEQVALEFLIVAVAAEFLIVLLLFLQRPQPLGKALYQWKGSQAGFGLGPVSYTHLFSAGT